MADSKEYLVNHKTLLQIIRVCGGDVKRLPTCLRSLQVTKLPAKADDKESDISFEKFRLTLLGKRKKILNVTTKATYKSKQYVGKFREAINNIEDSFAAYPYKDYTSIDEYLDIWLTKYVTLHGMELNTLGFQNILEKVNKLTNLSITNNKFNKVIPIFKSKLVKLHPQITKYYQSDIAFHKAIVELAHTYKHLGEDIYNRVYKVFVLYKKHNQAVWLKTFFEEKRTIDGLIKKYKL